MSDRHPFSFTDRTTVRIIAATLVVISMVGCSSAPKRDATEFCTAYVDTARLAATLKNPDDLSLPALRSKVAAIDDRARDASQRAPEDIADTVETVITPLHRLRKDLDDADTRTATTQALVRYRNATRQIAADQKRLDAWATEACGIVPITTTTTPVTIQPGLTG